MKRTRRVGSGMLSVMVLTITALVACGGGEPVPVDAPADPVSVVVTEAWSDAARTQHSARVEAARAADVATRASGTILSVTVDVGDPVRAGQILATLDAEDVEARIAAAMARVELAERMHGRLTRLAADGAASQQELDEAAASMQGAQAQLAEARAQAAYVRVAAPFDGVVVARMADAGDLAVPGRPVLRLAAGGDIKVVADLPSALAGTLADGTVVHIRAADGRVIQGVLTRVVPSLNAATRRFRVEASPSDPSAFRAGQVVRLELAGAGEGTRWVAADALVRRGQLTGVFAVEDGTLRLRWVRVGRTEGEAVELLAGPAGPLTVVRRPADGLRDGQPVSSATTEVPPGPANPPSVEVEGGP